MTEPATYAATYNGPHEEVELIDPETQRVHVVEQGGTIEVSERCARSLADQGVNADDGAGVWDVPDFDRKYDEIAAESAEPVVEAPPATPRAAQLAAGAGVDLAGIAGTGAEGRITVGDVNKAIAERDAAQGSGAEQAEQAIENAGDDGGEG